MYGFDLNTLERLQYLEYQTGHYFKPHFDIGHLADAAVRKLIVSVQLSEPEDYDGGELVVTEASGDVAATTGIGDAIYFPTYMRHEATKITRGTRKCIVGWMCGQRPFA